MSDILSQLASSLGRADEAPNIELAETIVATDDREAIGTLIAALDHADSAVRSDALKALYEAGKRNPSLLSGYAPTFTSLLRSRSNRLVWGSMEALAALASEHPDQVTPHFDEIVTATESGSVITRDWGVRAIAAMAISDSAVRPRATAFLLELLRTCRPSEFPRHAESAISLFALEQATMQAYRQILEERLPELSPAQARRANRLKG